MTTPGGYVRVHRSLIGHPAFRNDAEAMAFAWLVMRASWQPVELRYKGKLVTLARGQLAVSIRDFAAAMDRDKGWIERVLKRLRDRRMIETVKGTAALVITICNYNEYQGEEATTKTPRKTVKKTDARQTQDTEQGREEGKEKETPQPPEGARRGKHPLPEDWILPAVDELPEQAKACASMWTADSYAAHGEEFVSFWRSRGRMMKDWRLTWAGRVVDIHPQVMRDQKHGNAPPGTANRKLTPVELKERDLRNADFYDRIGRADDAAEIRRKWATGPPDVALRSAVAGIMRKAAGDQRAGERQ